MSGFALGTCFACLECESSKRFAHMSKTFAVRLCFRFLFVLFFVFFFFLILFSAVVVLAKNTQNVHGTSGGDAVIDAPFMSISR